MSDEHMDDFLRELRDDLNAVRPSPEFAAKVRQQVAAQPERRWFGIWQLATAASIVAVTAVALVLWRTHDPASELPVPMVTTTEDGVKSPTPAEVPIAQSPRPRPTNQTAVRRAPTAAAVRTQPIAVREPEVLVPGDQQRALVSLLTSMRHLGNQVPTESATEVDSDGRLPAPAAIKVSVITIEPLSPPVPGGGSRERQ